MNIKPNTEIVFSINVHEKTEFLKKQIKNIAQYVHVSYVIILNASPFMHQTIINDTNILNNPRIILHKTSMQKYRFHGTLTKGIYANMILALEEFNFDKFVVLSSRNMFYNTLESKCMDRIPIVQPKQRADATNLCQWHWPKFRKTALGTFFIKHNLFLQQCFHEGLTFCSGACKAIHKFLQSHPNIRNDLFQSRSCVEEFALQSICLNFHGPYYHIGNFTMKDDTNRIKSLPKDRYVYKTRRI